ncbi:MAG: ABC transporter permease [Streptosporangiaceae bacterium]
MTSPLRAEQGWHAMAHDTAVLTGRSIRITLQRSALISAVSMPLMFLFAFFVLFRSLLAAQGLQYSQYLPPAIVAQAMMLGAMSTAFFVTSERRSGTLARWRIMPIHRSAVLLARLTADSVRALIAVVAVAVAACLLGFRFHSVPGALGFVLVAVGFAISLGTGTAAIGLAARSPEVIVSLLFVPYLPLLILSNGYMPASQFPGWARPVVSASPVSAVIGGLRSLADGHLVAAPVAQAVAWEAGLGLVFGLLAVRALRKAR